MTLSTHGHGLAMGMCEDCLLEFKQGEVECVMTTCSMLLAFFAECADVAARRGGCEVRRHTFEKCRPGSPRSAPLESRLELGGDLVTCCKTMQASGQKHGKLVAGKMGMSGLTHSRGVLDVNPCTKIILIMLAGRRLTFEDEEVDVDASQSHHSCFH